MMFGENEEKVTHQTICLMMFGYNADLPGLKTAARMPVFLRLSPKPIKIIVWAFFDAKSPKWSQKKLTRLFVLLCLMTNAKNDTHQTICFMMFGENMKKLLAKPFVS